MLQEVIAIFDIGKTTKKFLLFSSMLKPVYQEEEILNEIPDDENFACDDIRKIEAWMRQCLSRVIQAGVYSIRALNFTSCETSLMHLDFRVEGRTLSTGIGIQDTLASLIPYLKYSEEPFILISAGTWCVFMNPFNAEPLTWEQILKDTLCYMSIHKEQVKSSRLLLGPVHDVNVEKLNKYFGVTADYYKTIRTNSLKIEKLMKTYKGRVYFRNGMPSDYIDNTADLSHFLTYADAYHQLMADLVDLCMESLGLIMSHSDQIITVYITGKFARNELFVRLLAARLPKKKVFTAEVDHAAALGAAMVVWNSAFDGEMPFTGLGLKAILSD